MQGGEGTMRARWWPGLLLLSAILALGILEAAWGQTAPIPGLEKLTPEERALALENYRRWKSMSPEEQQAARENYKRFRQLSPEEKARVLKDFQRWNELPEGRRQELQKAYERFQALPPDPP